MKWINIILLFVFIVIHAGCGKQGQEGDVFLRLRHGGFEPINFSTENPDIPIDFQYGVYYKTSPGTYAFTYIDHNYIEHPREDEFGFIDIVARPGESGELFKSGDDGEDLYIDLLLYSDGPLIQQYNYLTSPGTMNVDMN